MCFKTQRDTFKILTLSLFFKLIKKFKFTQINRANVSETLRNTQLTQYEFIYRSRYKMILKLFYSLLRRFSISLFYKIPYLLPGNSRGLNYVSYSGLIVYVRGTIKYMRKIKYRKTSVPFILWMCLRKMYGNTYGRMKIIMTQIQFEPH